VSDVFIAHVAKEHGGDTLCGESWQGWQAPDGPGALDPQARSIPPHHSPRPHEDQIRQCQACWRLTFGGR